MRGNELVLLLAYLIPSEEKGNNNKQTTKDLHHLKEEAKIYD